jgi:hypothetical protein
MSGSGDGTISLSATEHTGRVQRTGTVTITGTGVQDPETVAVTQAAKPEFVQFDNNAQTIAAPAAGGNLTLSGTSNSSKLRWAAVGTATDENGQTVNPETGLDYPEVPAPTTYTANGAEAHQALISLVTQVHLLSSHSLLFLLFLRTMLLFALTVPTRSLTMVVIAFRS